MVVKELGSCFLGSCAQGHTLHARDARMLMHATRADLQPRPAHPNTDMLLTQHVCTEQESLVIETAKP